MSRRLGPRHPDIGKPCGLCGAALALADYVRDDDEHGTVHATLLDCEDA